MISILLANKFYGNKKDAVTVEILVYYSDYSYTPDQLIKGEKYILCSIFKYNLSFVISFDFFRYYYLISALNDSDYGCECLWVINMLRERSNSLIEFLITDLQLVREKPSIAAAALMAATRRTFGLTPWTKTLQMISGYKLIDFERVFKIIWVTIIPHTYLKNYLTEHVDIKVEKLILKTVRNFAKLFANDAQISFSCPYLGITIAAAGIRATGKGKLMINFINKMNVPKLTIYRGVYKIINFNKVIELHGTIETLLGLST